MITAEKPKRATVYLDPQLHKALKLQAAETGCNVSELINEAVRRALIEDRDDLSVFEHRASEPTLSFEKLVKNLDLDGKL
ncbi:MAG: ribbon-helix-helix domain-containing protein [Verrucomicrobiales bacterium]|nr:ribbon-helix-helix domain-containing protein [Verrucomicrobiales bacterium]